VVVVMVCVCVCVMAASSLSRAQDLHSSALITGCPDGRSCTMVRQGCLPVGRHTSGIWHWRVASVFKFGGFTIATLSETIQRQIQAR
jgi:hypothetical protein